MKRTKFTEGQIAFILRQAQDFTAEGPDQKWGAGISYIWTAEGLTRCRDLHSDSFCSSMDHKKHQRDISMGIAAYGTLGIAFLSVLWAFTTYNRLVRHRNTVAEAWSGIDAQLKRRADLIPNLVATVQGYAGHERATFEDLARLRGQARAGRDIAHRAETERAITAAVHRIMALAEAYPQLRASENFLSLQQELAEVEDQLQLARRYYNGTVRNLNVMIEQAPSNLIATCFAFRTASFFQIENEADRAVPSVAVS